MAAKRARAPTALPLLPLLLLLAGWQAPPPAADALLLQAGARLPRPRAPPPSSRWAARGPRMMASERIIPEYAEVGVARLGRGARGRPRGRSDFSLSLRSDAATDHEGVRRE